jgi:hypothetical protein
VALGLEIEEVAMQKSALQEFEAKLVLLEMGEELLQKSIAEARRAGYLKNRNGDRARCATAAGLGRAGEGGSCTTIARPKRAAEDVSCLLPPPVRTVPYAASP